MSKKYSEKIIELLQRDDFPPIVALNGSWGVGKTFYITESLITELNERANEIFEQTTITPDIVNYFSITGVDSLKAFQDKLISSTYFQEDTDSTLISSTFKSLTDFAAKISSEKSDSAGITAAASIINASGGCIRSRMLQKINNKIIIIDDLERLDDQALIKKIIGECLNLSLENNLKFIFSVNMEQLRIDSTQEEKYFSGKINYSASSYDVMQISFLNWGEVYKNYEDEIIKSIEVNDLKNIRVIKRISNKLLHIYNLCEKKSNEFNLDLNMQRFISSVFSIGTLHFVHGIKSSEICDSMRAGVSMSEEPKNYIYDFSICSVDLVKFVCDDIVDVFDITMFGELISTSKNVDRLYYDGHCYIDEEIYLSSIKELIEIITSDDDEYILNWFRALDTYCYLVKHGFIQNNLDVYKILDAKMESNSLMLQKAPVVYEFRNKFVFEKFLNKKKEIEDREKENRDEVLNNNFMNSWKDVDLSYYKSFSGYPVVATKHVEKWCSAITNWDLISIHLFGDFITSKYIEDNNSVVKAIKSGRANFKEEYKALINLNESLKKLTSTMPIGRKKGAISILINDIDLAAAELERLI
ncbi:P-loop NTPase fold protein [Vibrio alginolyticus]